MHIDWPSLNDKHLLDGFSQQFDGATDIVFFDENFGQHLKRLLIFRVVDGFFEILLRLETRQDKSDSDQKGKVVKVSCKNLFYVFQVPIANAQVVCYLLERKGRGCF